MCVCMGAHLWAPMHTHILLLPCLKPTRISADGQICAHNIAGVCVHVCEERVELEQVKRCGSKKGTGMMANESSRLIRSRSTNSDELSSTNRTVRRRFLLLLSPPIYRVLRNFSLPGNLAYLSKLYLNL